MQMLLANTLKLVLLKSDSEILRLFLDIPSTPFGIHTICEQGKLVMFKEPGDWYGVNSIAQVLQSIFESRARNKDHL
jgi:hypothetical protein